MHIFTTRHSLHYLSLFYHHGLFIVHKEDKQLAKKKLIKLFKEEHRYVEPNENVYELLDVQSNSRVFEEIGRGKLLFEQVGDDFDVNWIKLKCINFSIKIFDDQTFFTCFEILF